MTPKPSAKALAGGPSAAATSTAPSLVLPLADDAATRRLGEDLAMAVRPGEVVALAGDLGAGKSTLARALIRTLAADPELEVPSPTYTLVQSYDTLPPVAHFDLYRLSEPSELDELGFEEAAQASVVLVEWPERAEAVQTRADLRVALEIEGDGRRATITGDDAPMQRLSRSLAIRAFLERSGIPVANRRRFQNDASPRRYETVERDGRTAIVMDAPRLPAGVPVRDGLPYTRVAHIAEDVLPFVALATALRERGFAAPRIFDADLDAGLVLLEHLGADGPLDAERRPLAERYRQAAVVLAELHATAWPRDHLLPGGLTHRVPDFDRGALTIEVELMLEWYCPFGFGRPATAAERETFAAVWSSLFDRLETADRSLVLRDYHSPNIIWRPAESGRERIGILDFQDSMIGPSAYDLASLAQDARVDMPPELEATLYADYVAARMAAGVFDPAGFAEAYAITAAQRATKLLGIFVRLKLRDGKPQYLGHIPRIKGYLDRTLGHPVLAELRALYRAWGIVERDAR
ncbi:tRNA (adenosine(37)-N6)-threonylcarbamoyltransferase complex ATPase subunit type 1 TsaE [Aurantimonas sp. MSK8Z-1]|uniref:tRNA (adenosine(37)-N6)-threonylcarbamoyltransferase complex ATPase subunit type 1 TsaE n=1 Tax=Mangrovibrevibacter kandeliae TaxID=2968473 RepID=UPI0021190230|nr:tRNA (adenosine(37)-N6)-threonylcarbamoyltransferase complex ATPase subunit type 1 TsaE [Aurantimonas sp. MSK8Z-1]MCW4115132.1 tRNA (adenosine(37)-N6)-threonylcarbamoyltransferase complex ATPase subunit type 1 TsaE [Aurantimonas sp. MSK8Z-1]